MRERVNDSSPNFCITAPTLPASMFEELWGSASKYVAYQSFYWYGCDGDTLHWPMSKIQDVRSSLTFSGSLSFCSSSCSAICSSRPKWICRVFNELRRGNLLNIMSFWVSGSEWMYIKTRMSFTVSTGWLCFFLLFCHQLDVAFVGIQYSV